jgi:P27 family predicted phage terminase small subunit
MEGRAPGRDSGGREVKPPPAFIRLPPKPPTWMGREAKAEWRRVVPELTRLKLLKPITRGALTAYCEMWQTFVVATGEVHKHGLVVANHSIRKDGSESIWYTANPAVQIQRNAQQALRLWCAEFGLTPAAEGRLQTPEDEPNGEDENPFG